MEYPGKIDSPHRDCPAESFCDFKIEKRNRNRFFVRLELFWKSGSTKFDTLGMHVPGYPGRVRVRGVLEFVPVSSCSDSPVPKRYVPGCWKFLPGSLARGPGYTYTEVAFSIQPLAAACPESEPGYRGTPGTRPRDEIRSGTVYKGIKTRNKKHGRIGRDSCRNSTAITSGGASFHTEHAGSAAKLSELFCVGVIGNPFTNFRYCLLAEPGNF
eukprot:1379327-Rhodomonas_salina.3